MYIRVFILASDIDDAVEEKLLVGDKPKVFALTPETRDTVKERVAEKKNEELVDVRSLSSRREFTTSNARIVCSYQKTNAPSSLLSPPSATGSHPTMTSPARPQNGPSPMPNASKSNSFANSGTANLDHSNLPVPTVPTVPHHRSPRRILNPHRATLLGRIRMDTCTSVRATRLL